MKVFRIVSMVLLMVSAQIAAAETTIKRDVVYGYKDGMALIYNVLSPADANGAAVVFMVSGGWFSRVSPPEAYARQFSSLLDNGFTVIPVNHGSAPRYKVPDAYADVSRAIRHIKMHADSYGIDTDRIGVFGGSAGGHLSLMLGYDSSEGDSSAADDVMHYDNSVAAVVAYFPPVDLRPIVGPNDRFPALDFAESQAEAISPLLHVDPHDPPTLLVHGDADDLVPISASEVMYEELRNKNVKSEFITIPGGQHGFRGENAAIAGRHMLQWFQAHLE